MKMIQQTRNAAKQGDGWTCPPALLLMIGLAASFAMMPPEASGNEIDAPTNAPVAKIIKIDTLSTPSRRQGVWIYKAGILGFISPKRKRGKAGMELEKGEWVIVGRDTNVLMVSYTDSVNVTLHPRTAVKVFRNSIFTAWGVAYIERNTFKGPPNGFRTIGGSVDIGMRSTEYVFGVNRVRDSLQTALAVLDGVVTVTPTSGTPFPPGRYVAGQKVHITGGDSLRVGTLSQDQITALRDDAINGQLTLRDDGAIINQDGVVLAANTVENNTQEPDPEPIPQPWQRFAAGNPGLETTLAAWWKLDAPGRQITALSGVGNSPDLNGTINGNIRAVPQGRIRGASEFRGKAHITVPDHPALNVGGGNFTVSAWVRPDGAGHKPILTKNQGLSGGGFTFSLNENNQPFSMLFEERAGHGYAWDRSIDDRTWAHVAWVVTPSSKQIACYVNGSLVGIKSWGGITLSDIKTPLYIGFGQYEGAYFQGMLDEVMFFKKALSREEIRRLSIWRDTP